MLEFAAVKKDTLFRTIVVPAGSPLIVIVLPLIVVAVETVIEETVILMVEVLESRIAATRPGPLDTSTVPTCAAATEQNKTTGMSEASIFFILFHFTTIQIYREISKL